MYVECGSPESNNINKLYAYNNNNNNIRKVNLKDGFTQIHTSCRKS